MKRLCVGPTLCPAFRLQDLGLGLLELFHGLFQFLLFDIHLVECILEILVQSVFLITGLLGEFLLFPPQNAPKLWRQNGE